MSELTITTDHKWKNFLYGYELTAKEKKKGYNPYALGIYLNRIEEIISDIENGAGVQDALGAGFSGTLLNHLAKAVQVSAAESGKYFYEPCGKKSTKKC